MNKELPPEVKKYLSKCGLNTWTLESGVNKNYNTNEALYFAFKNNSKDCVDLLIDDNINVDQVMNIERY